MFTGVINFIEQLNELQKISLDNQITADILDFDEILNKQSTPTFYKDFTTIKKDNTIYIHNLFIDKAIDNQHAYLYNITEQKYINFNNVKNTNINIYRGFINEYNNSLEHYKRYWQNHKTDMIIDFIEHFYFVLNQMIKQQNQNYYKTIIDIYNKLENIEQNNVYNKFFGNKKLYLPVLFYINNFNINDSDSKKVNVYLTYKIELNINLEQRIVIKLNSTLPVIDKQKFEKLIDILTAKKIINNIVKNYLTNRLDKFPLFNDFTVKDDIVKIRLIDYIDVKLLPYLFIVNALYSKKIYN